MVEELRRADAEVICVVTESSPRVREKFSSTSMRVFGEPVGLQQVLPQTRLVISNGGGALTSQALLGGVPMLMLPAHTEQLMQSICVERLGAGRTIGMQRDRSTIASAIGEVLNSTQYQIKARAFAQKYASYDSSESVKSAAHSVLCVAGEQRRRH